MDNDDDGDVAAAGVAAQPINTTLACKQLSGGSDLDVVPPSADDPSSLPMMMTMTMTQILHSACTAFWTKSLAWVMKTSLRLSSGRRTGKRERLPTFSPCHTAATSSFGLQC